jgi:flagellar motility protein MotE (MotC chaperone)
LIIRKRHDQLQVELQISDGYLNKFCSYDITQIIDEIKRIITITNTHIKNREILKTGLQEQLAKINSEMKEKKRDLDILEHSLNVIESNEKEFKETLKKGKDIQV